MRLTLMTLAILVILFATACDDLENINFCRCEFSDNNSYTCVCENGEQPKILYALNKTDMKRLIMCCYDCQRQEQ